MQIDRVTAAAALALALLIGMLLLLPQALPEQSGPGGNGAVTDRPAPPPADMATVPSPAETGGEKQEDAGNFHAALDPVSEIHLSQPGTVLINGTTDAPAGTILRIDFIAVSMHPSPMEYHPDLWFSTNASVMQGTGSDGTWSVEIHPQEFRKPDRWQVLINEAASGRSIGSGYLNVTA